MKQVILFTLKAQTLEIDDSLSQYSYYVTPSLKENLPIRRVEFSKELLHVEPADRQIRHLLQNARMRGLLTKELIFACDPAAAAILNEPYRKENERLKQVAAKGLQTERLIRNWDALPWWRRLVMMLRGNGFRRFIQL